ncbi:dephospho-CoA kinase [Pelagirhabdus alkalitolerans]|uniref:Dephospho-CoA kinase n=1 Tax=Pelagirhabdus alkalitolerans TaxID=1612202 RepID=A0A1G6HK79_9BACI|nr:dephospho-CoA kinase [Pelagirhabdus alkalitolerans]SDB94737.1 dephospho-CoA kinase [Pelagirhabdus alkalitolerans]
MTLVIGLTGSIATGKSTISKLFNQHSIPVIDADVIARRVVEPNQPAYKKVVRAFGENILDDDLTIDRPKLANVIFHDPNKRQELESIVHPEIIDQLKKERDALIKENVPLIVLDIPLLFEKKLDDLVDIVLVVYTEKSKQLKRLIDRDHFSKEEAQKRIDSQISIDKKAQKADVVIDNSASLEQTKHQFDRLLNQWLNGKGNE